MSKKRLVEYIRQYHKIYPLEAIKSRLLEDGWNEEEVNSAISLFESPPNLEPPEKEAQSNTSLPNAQTNFSQFSQTSQVISQPDASQTQSTNQIFMAQQVQRDKSLKKINVWIWIVSIFTLLLIAGAFVYWKFFMSA